MADALSHLIVDGRTVCHPTGGPRGIGRYVIGLLSGLRQIHAPVIALYETEEQKSLLTRAVPDLDLRQLEPAVIRDLSVPGSWYLATQLMLHPIPLDPVPRIITDSGLPVAAIMYDVIRERHPELYQVRAESRAQVLIRGMLARTLDALLAISDFAADTAAEELHFPRDRITMIGAGVDPKFAPAVDDPWPRLQGVLRADRRRIVVTVTGEDPRKNTTRLAQAWATLPATLRRSHRLVVIGDSDEVGTADVDFTGPVTDEQLVAIYQFAELAVMPSTDEGFGLPALEAAACGCAVITSNVSALPEVLAEPAAQFDPYDVTAIAAAVERALIDSAHRELLLAAAQRALTRWTWTNVGRAVVSSLEELDPRRVRQLRKVPYRVAVTGTFDDSVIGRANTSRVHELAKQSPLAEITLLVDNSANDHSTNDRATNAGPQRFPVRALGRFVPRSQFDEVITLD